MRCLEKRPADRPQSASEVVHALDDITTPGGGMTPTGTQASRGGSRRWGAIAAAAAALVLVIVIASWLLATRTGGAAKLRSIAVLPTEIGRAPSELQSQSNLVCRLLLEKKKKHKIARR